MEKMTRAQFFEAIAPAVIRIRQEGSLMFSSVRLAQSLLESGGAIPEWNNLGGIKVGSGKTNAYWQGEAVVKSTLEYVDGRSVSTQAAFRAYKSIYHFYKDLDLLLASARYERVRAAGTPELQAAMLQACGYATDPAYPTKLVAIINQYQLKKYDAMNAAPAQRRHFENAGIVPIAYKGLVAAFGYLQNGTTWVPARSLGESFGAVIGWTGSKVTVNGKELESILSESTGFVKVRDLAAELSLSVEWDAAARVVILGSPLRA